MRESLARRGGGGSDDGGGGGVLGGGCGCERESARSMSGSSDWEVEEGREVLKDMLSRPEDVRGRER